jgi:maltooligosyltrehalose trehalohydrolase
MQHSQPVRRMAVGAEVLASGGVHFRVWAPRCRLVEVIVEGNPGFAMPLQPDDKGYFSGRCANAVAGTLYRFRLDGSSYLYPDPASRFQPQGPHGPSQVIDPSTFPWTDGLWTGVRREGQVLYEMHIGTFTREGTWEPAQRELPALADLGITVLEIMPVSEFPGLFGWGYDGVDLYAPTRLYGTPDEFRRFVDCAHSLGLGVILDVVYNHLGPDGNYLKQFAKEYFTDRYTTDWGEALNFDGPGAGPVREFFVSNAGYWIEEFHLDGLRLDATQTIYDSSDDNILTAIGRRVREAARGRAAFIVAENEPQLTRLVYSPEKGGYGLDALWNDDFHHSAMVALTGHNEAYYSDHRGSPQEFLSAIKWGFLYQGQRYARQKQRRGTPSLDLAPAHFIHFLQNHDQVANSARGLRCHQLTSPGRYRALSALLLLAPQTPMLFQGQEFAASAPFNYFADHQPDLARLVARGRAEFLRQFPSIEDPEVSSSLPDPADVRTFERCKLDFAERATHAEQLALHRDLLKLRREEPAFRSQRKGTVDGAVLEDRAFVLRFFANDGNDRVLVVNLGADLCLEPVPEPLMAPPEKRRWRLLWSSENLRYGGGGTPTFDPDETWQLPGESALVFATERRPENPGGD